MRERSGFSYARTACRAQATRPAEHPAPQFRDQFPDLHRYYCAVALLMLAATKEARRRNREVETQAIFREWFRELTGKNESAVDIGVRINTF
jgi:hypothetical protein